MNSLRLEIGEQPRFTESVGAVATFISELSALFARLTATACCCSLESLFLDLCSHGRCQECKDDATFQSVLVQIQSKAWITFCIFSCQVIFEATCLVSGGGFALQARGAGCCAQGSAQVGLAGLL